jgi:hypothetical protein
MTDLDLELVIIFLFRKSMPKLAIPRESQDDCISYAGDRLLLSPKLYALAAPKACILRKTPCAPMLRIPRGINKLTQLREQLVDHCLDEPWVSPYRPSGRTLATSQGCGLRR